MREERRKSRIESKCIHKGIQPLNGKMMFFDFPFKRPEFYYIVLENGDELQVSPEEYREFQIGETISYDQDVWEKGDYILLTAIILVLAVVTVAAINLL